MTSPQDDPFAAVPPTLRAALERRGFTQLTEVQTAILAADDGVRDLRISSQTGSGKTVALGIALSRQVVAAQRVGPTTLVVTPTRELAAQVKEELSWLFADLPDVRCGVVTGGTSIVRERQLLQRRPAVLVGTPGRLLDHIGAGALDLGSVTQLVLDEADQMLDLGFKDELDAILEALPKTRRTHLVSATFPSAVKALADRFQSSPLLVAGTAAGAAHGDIEHVALKVGSRDHYAVLVNLLLLAGDERTLVFVRTREDTTALADKLAGDGFLAMPIHGDLAQSQRTRTLQAFRRGAIHTLIATDVAARGLDIQDVTSVVHFDPPIDAETYVHRSGRTGRAGQKGRSYMFVVKTRANFARRLYHQARVEPSWEACPGAAEVAAHRLAQAGERAAAALQNAATPSEAQNEIAARLLADRDPRAVVAMLLGQMAVGAREPFEIAGAREPVAGKPAAAGAAVEPAATAAPSPAPASPAEPTAAPVVVPAPAGAAVRKLPADKRGKPGAPPSWQRPPGEAAAAAPSSGAFQRFRINWGSRDGADARRVMAHVCRRCELDSQMVGAIHVQPGSTVFEIATAFAAEFERRARRPDRRDPHLVIARDRFGDR